MEFHLYPRAIMTIITRKNDLNFVYNYGSDGNLYHKPLKCASNFVFINYNPHWLCRFPFNLHFLLQRFTCRLTGARREEMTFVNSFVVLLFLNIPSYSFMYF